jgi:hypothetical protein
MLSAIRSTHRPTPLGRVTAALPALPRRHSNRRLQLGTGALTRPGLGVVLILVIAFIYRAKLASIVSHDDGGAAPAADAPAHEPAAPDTAEE